MQCDFDPKMLLRGKPFAYGLAYFFLVFFFSLIYFSFFSKEFNCELNLFKSFYFSVVTSTTLGYGDIQPSLSNNNLLMVISLQVVLGVLIFGMFLNSVAQRISDEKDEAYRAKENEIFERRQKISLMLLKPFLNNHLQTIALLYKVTLRENDESNSGNFIASEFLNENICKQIVHINFQSNQTQYGSSSGNIGYVVNNEFKELKSEINNFLEKFSLGLDNDILDCVVQLNCSEFLNSPKLYLAALSFAAEKEKEIGEKVEIDFENNRYWGLYEKDEAVFIVHQHFKLLSRLLKEIKRFEQEEILISIQLRNDISPKIGSAYLE
jgi:hypothetical protein